MHRTITDTADRMRPGDYLHHEGRRWYVADMLDASGPSRPGGIAVVALDGSDSLAAPSKLFLLTGSGLVVTFTRERSPQNLRGYAMEETLRVRRIGQSRAFEVWTPDSGWQTVMPGPAASTYGMNCAEASEHDLTAFAYRCAEVPA